jgi:hypothetical protein
MAVVVRFDVFLVMLDPTVGSEIQKTRPCHLLVMMASLGSGLRLKIVLSEITQHDFLTRNHRILFDRRAIFDNLKRVNI